MSHKKHPVSDKEKRRKVREEREWAPQTKKEELEKERNRKQGKWQKVERAKEGEKRRIQIWKQEPLTLHSHRMC